MFAIYQIILLRLHICVWNLQNYSSTLIYFIDRVIFTGVFLDSAWTLDISYMGSENNWIDRCQWNCMRRVSVIHHLARILKSVNDWASSTGLTAVSKFKPRLPAQWAVGTHRIGPSRMEKVTSRMNWPIRNSTQIRIRIELVGNTIMWNPSLFFISNRFYKTQNNFGPWNDHIITEFSWVVTQSASINLCRHWPVGDLWPNRITISPWAEKVVHSRRWILSLSFQRKNTSFAQIYHQNPAH